jgi:3-hydroxyisobutyrate dehydrogenase-like beta-hydroxyacid dehydrogenase
VAVEKTGLGVDALHQFLEMMFPGPYEAHSNRMRLGDYYKREEPLFAADLAMKDARHAQASVNKAGVHMKNVEEANAYLKIVKGAYGNERRYRRNL